MELLIKMLTTEPIGVVLMLMFLAFLNCKIKKKRSVDG